MISIRTYLLGGGVMIPDTISCKNMFMWTHYENIITITRTFFSGRPKGVRADLEMTGVGGNSRKEAGATPILPLYLNNDNYKLSGEVCDSQHTYLMTHHPAALFSRTFMIAPSGKETSSGCSPQ